MIELLLDDKEAKLVLMGLATTRDCIYKEGSDFWNASKRIEGYIEYMLNKKNKVMSFEEMLNEKEDQ